jgi:hypothetical protein
MTEIRAWAAMKPGGKLERFTYTSEPVGPEEVLVEVEHCASATQTSVSGRMSWAILPFRSSRAMRLPGRLLLLERWRRRRAWRLDKPSA